MIHLSPDEARVLGVLIEKAMTTPDQYPLSQNAVVNGANQKNNRYPVLMLDENQAFDALEGLRGKGLVVRVDQAGSRVNKYRHAAGDALKCRPAELALLAELLLRGPQTLGELRGRASRMQAFESLEAVKNMLAALRERSEPLVTELPPSPGSRAERYAQLLSPQSHDTQEQATEAESDSANRGAETGTSASLSDRVVKLETEVEFLRGVVRRLAQSLGDNNPFSPAAQSDVNPTTIV